MADHKVFKGQADTIFLGGYNISGDSNRIDLNSNIDEKESTSFVETFKNYEAGLQSCRGTVDVMLHADHTILEAGLSSGYGTAQVLSFMADGMVAGSISHSMSGVSVKLTRGAKVGELYATSIELSCKGTPHVRGKLLEAVVSRAASADTAGIQFTGGVSATQSLYISYHVTEMTGTSLDAVLQRDDNSGFTSALTAITMSNFTGVGAEAKSLAGALTDDWYRLSFTLNGAGAFTVAAVIAVQ